MIEVYVLEGCPYCQNTLTLLKKSGKEYKKIIVPLNKKDYYKKKHNMNTFPQIMINIPNKKIKIKYGGNDDIIKGFEIINILKNSDINNEALYLFINYFR